MNNKKKYNKLPIAITLLTISILIGFILVKSHFYTVINLVQELKWWEMILTLFDIVLFEIGGWLVLSKLKIYLKKKK